jgi:alanyl-tRNA synthetase
VHQVKWLVSSYAKDTVVARVNTETRNATRRNHTATHLAHAALRQVLGAHVKQAGSVVDSTRLRFDFSHYTAVSREELLEIERLANLQILRNAEVSTRVMDIDQALETGAMALFGEKYGDKVRVVTVDGYSRELCGGTHVTRTGDIGMLKIVSEGSISAGVRRLEAVTGAGALERFQATTALVHQVSSALHASESDLAAQLEKLLDQHRQLERQVDQLKTQAAHSAAAALEARAQTVGAARVLCAFVEGLDRAQMRNLADELRNKWKTAAIVLASGTEGDVAIVAAVTKDLTKSLHAGKLAGAVAQAVGGKGGGRPDMAEAGGKQLAPLQAALDAASKTIAAAL